MTSLSIVGKPWLSIGGCFGGVLDPSTRKQRDRWVVVRFYPHCLEGDDDIVAVGGVFTEVQIQDITPCWIRWGFNMKLYVRTKVAEFTGWKMALSPDGKILRDHMVPDILRTLTNSAHTRLPRSRKPAFSGVSAGFVGKSHSHRLAPTSKFCTSFRRSTGTSTGRSSSTMDFWASERTTQSHCWSRTIGWCSPKKTGPSQRRFQRARPRRSKPLFISLVLCEVRASTRKSARC